MTMVTEEKKEFNYDTIAAGYYDQVFRKNKGIQSKWHHLKFARVQSRMKDYKNHLDIGCGPGTLISLLDPNKPSVGIDVAGDQIDYAKKNYETANHQFIAVEGSGPLPFENRTFDVVTMIELIEHLSKEEVVALLAEVQRVLKSHGRLIITTPNYLSLWPVLEIFVNRLSPVSYKDQHVTQYTKSRLKKFLQDNSFAFFHLSAFQFSAPFFAAIHWKLSDVVNAMETTTFGKWFGNLLIGEVTIVHKPKRG